MNYTNIFQAWHGTAWHGTVDLKQTPTTVRDQLLHTSRITVKCKASNKIHSSLSLLPEAVYVLSAADCKINCQVLS